MCCCSFLVIKPCPRGGTPKGDMFFEPFGPSVYILHPHLLKKRASMVGFNLTTGPCHQGGLLSYEIRCLCPPSLLLKYQQAGSSRSPVHSWRLQAHILGALLEFHPYYLSKIVSAHIFREPWNEGRLLVLWDWFKITFTERSIRKHTIRTGREVPEGKTKTGGGGPWRKRKGRK